DFYDQSLALADELKMRPLVARIELSLGRLHRVAGTRAKAETHLGAALALLREMDMRFWSARAADELMALGSLFIVGQDHAELYEYLKREFAGQPVTVILDRRRGERRLSHQPRLGEERRRGERRRQPDVDEALRTRAFAVLPPSSSSATEAAHA